MFLVVPNEDKPRRVLLFGGLAWILSTLIIPLLPESIVIPSFFLVIFLAILFIFYVAWHIPGWDTSNWVDIPIKMGIWCGAGISLCSYQIKPGMKSWTLIDDITVGIGIGCILIVASLPVFGIAYLVMLFIRTFITPGIHCRHCTYDLTGNQTGTCPECGQTIDFADQQILKKKQAQSVENHSEHSGE